MSEEFFNIEQLSEGFVLNMQILADALTEAFDGVTFYAKTDHARLKGVKLYQKGKNLHSQYAYIIHNHEITDAFMDYRNISFIIIGIANISIFHKSCPVIAIHDKYSFLEILDLLQQTFEKYQKWDRLLQLALNSDHPLDDMLAASLDIFQNPLFVHDTNFYILACPRYVPGMLVFEQDARTGRTIAPLSLIHDFNVDMEYLDTLKKHQPAMFSAALRGYRILYANLWNEERYEGRICIDELQSEIQLGNYWALEYLGKFIELAIKRKNLFRLSMGNDMDRFFNDYLDGTLKDQQLILNYLFFLNWKQHDRYLCLCLNMEQQDMNMISSPATLGHIQTQIPAGHAFIYRQSIAVIVNLSYGHASVSEVISSLALLLREGLMKMGASSEIHDFLHVPQGYLQASAVLDLGRKSKSTVWCYRFDDYLLEYLLEKGGETIPPDLLCSDKILFLKNYDDKNNTDLYNTLKLYLELERNVLQTSKELFIHRSTLFYRLERIQKITGANLEDPKERLILRISFYIMEQKLNT